MFDSAKCFLGFHDWSQWKYKTPGSCVQTRTCKRKCDKSETRTTHSFREWDFVANDICVQQRFCERCDEAESRDVPHTWGQWTYTAPASCRQIRKCTRCEEPQSQTVHIWGDWKYIAPDSCEQRMVCERCDATRSRHVHNWAEWQYQEHPTLSLVEKHCQRTRFCHRCSSTADETVEHNWGVWKYKAPNSCYLTRKCTHCKRTESRPPRDDEHAWGEWTLKNRDSCHHSVRNCTRCNVEDERFSSDPAHEWGDWQLGKHGNMLRVCANCGEIEEKATPVEPSTTVHDMKVVHNAVEDLKEGMRIHVSFTAVQLKGVECELASYFSFETGQALKDFNNRYRSKDGHVAVHRFFVPQNGTATYSDFQLFMPYDELHLAQGQHSLVCVVQIRKRGEASLLAESKQYQFMVNV